MSDTTRPPLYRRLAFRIILLIGAFVQRLPISTRVRFGRALGSFAYRTMRGRARLARTNIQLALKVDRKQAARIAHESYRHAGRLFAEVLSLADYAEPDSDDLFEIEGFEHLERAHREGRGVIVFTAHIGNWEILGARQALAGYPVDAVAKELSNPDLDRWITSMRERHGNRVLGYKNILLRAVRKLKDGHILFILPDQYARTPPHLFLPFFGRRTAVTPFLARLALKLDVPVVPAYSIPREDGGYLLRYSEPLPHPAAGDADDRILELTALITHTIEHWVREYPEFWLWQHDRWKDIPAYANEQSGSAST